MRAVSPDRPSPRARPSRLDVGIVLLVALLSLVTVAVWIDPRIASIADARALDVAINVAATLVAAAVAILAWVRWRETGQVAALFESSAFVALATVNALTVAIVLLGRDAEFGLAAATSGGAAIYLWSLTRFTSALLLIAGALNGLARRRPVLPPLAIAVGPTIGVVVVSVALLAGQAALPPVPTPASVLRGGSGAALGPFGALVLVFQVVVVGLFVVSAVLFRRLHLRDGLVSHAFLAAGLVVAAFSQLQFAVDPIVATGHVTSADILRLLFHAILFMGVQAELESDLGALRRANGELHRLRDVDAANAALAERSRLAREIHDGLAQDLWYAKLKQGRLVQALATDDAARTTARDVLAAIDSALGEARQAVMAMRVEAASVAGLDELLATYVDDFADRFGVRARFERDGVLPRLAPRTEAEVLRIVQEALSNVRRHADATLVRVSVECTDGVATVRISDNGCGFEPAAVPADRYGLQGMRERAELIGARLAIDSRPMDGTRIVIELPLAAAGEA